jgi:tRNA threonylcarbamoyladenosine biosynthesis protein TsaE
MKVLSVVTRSAEETRIVGAALAPNLLPGDVLSLTGELGAGKTVVVQGLAAAMGVESRVTSPTFTIVHEYDGRYPIIHLDIYRLDSFQEVLDLGFEEFLDPSAIVVVEWGEAIGPLLPRRFLEVDIRRVDDGADDDRQITFKPHGAEWIGKIQSMRDTAETLLDAASEETGTGSRFVVSDLPQPRKNEDRAETHDDRTEETGT